MKLKTLLFTVLFWVSALAANAQLSEYDANAPLGFGANTTGGAGGSSVTVSTLSDLQSALKSSGKKIIYIKGAIKFSSMFTVSSQSDKTILGLPGSYLYSEHHAQRHFQKCRCLRLRWKRQPLF